jgi:hypothetical protein
LNAGGWLATASTATNTQQTQGMYPLASSYFDPTKSRWFTIRSKANNNICLDVTGSGGAGAKVIAWSCHNDSNQRWEFIPVSGSNQSLVTIRPRHALGTRVGYDASNNEEIQVASGATAQRWYVQQVPGGGPTTYQFVSAANGRCLSMRSVSNASNMPTVSCNDVTAQVVLQREPLTFTQSVSLLTFAFGGSNVSEAVKLQRNNGGTWIDVATVAAGSTSIQYTYTTANSALGTFLAVGNNDFRIVTTSGTTPLWDNIRLSRSGTTVTAVSGIG